MGNTQYSSMQVDKVSLKILMLEDDPLDAELNKEHLRLLEEYNCIVHWVVDKASYLQALQTECPDIILSDYNIPGYNGLEALKDLRAINSFIPFIVVTGTIDEETAAGTIKAGAWDYVVKDRLFRLPFAIRSVLLLKDERVNTARFESRNRQLSAAIEQSPVHYVITDTNNIIEYVNTKFTEVTGYSPEEVIGKDVIILIPDSLKEKYKESFNIINRTGEGWRGETQAKKKDGSIFWEYMHISPLKNEKGEITNYIAVKEDITKRKQMESELIQARDRAENSDRLKDAFLQNLSHEIRTPLNAIVGFSELLGRKAMTPDELKEFTSIIMSSSHQLLSIVNDVLTASRIQTGQETAMMKPVSINNVIEKLYTIFTPLFSSKSLTLSVNLQEKQISIITDETKLTQILSNFLNNALKFTPKGGAELGYVVNKKNIEFYVKDTGIGISKEYHEVIFERFRQVDVSTSRNFGGTGLGLSISKAFAGMINGTIRLESETDKGSTFFISIPYQSIADEEPVQIIHSEEFPNRTITILIAEDEIFNYELLEAYLDGTNSKIVHANNGLDAVEYCKGNPKIDIVLMDIKMPRMDGTTAMLEIKKLNQNLPIIAQTAYALESEKQMLLSKGFDDYLSKPIKRDELLRVVAKYTDSMK